MSAVSLLRRFADWLDRRADDRVAAAVSKSISSADPVMPAPPCAILAPQECSIVVYRHAGRMFERLAPERQEQAQRELYLRLKAAQMAGPQYEESEDRWSEIDVEEDQEPKAA